MFLEKNGVTFSAQDIFRGFLTYVAKEKVWLNGKNNTEWNRRRWQLADKEMRQGAN